MLWINFLCVKVLLRLNYNVCNMMCILAFTSYYKLTDYAVSQCKILY